MKNYLKIAISGIIVLVLAAIPATGFYLAWSWCMDQVPAAYEWAGLIKVGITLLTLMVGGGITVGLTVLLGGVGIAIAAAILD